MKSNTKKRNDTLSTALCPLVPETHSEDVFQLGFVLSSANKYASIQQRVHTHIYHFERLTYKHTKTLLETTFLLVISELLSTALTHIGPSESELSTL